MTVTRRYSKMAILSTCSYLKFELKNMANCTHGFSIKVPSNDISSSGKNMNVLRASINLRRPPSKSLIEVSQTGEASGVC